MKQDVAEYVVALRKRLDRERHAKDKAEGALSQVLKELKRLGASSLKDAGRTLRKLEARIAKLETRLERELKRIREERPELFED